MQKMWYGEEYMNDFTKNIMRHFTCNRCSTAPCKCIPILNAFSKEELEMIKRHFIDYSGSKLIDGKYYNDFISRIQAMINNYRDFPVAKTSDYE